MLSKAEGEGATPASTDSSAPALRQAQGEGAAATAEEIERGMEDMRKKFIQSGGGQSGSGNKSTEALCSPWMAELSDQHAGMTEGVMNTVTGNR